MSTQNPMSRVQIILELISQLGFVKKPQVFTVLDRQKHPIELKISYYAGSVMIRTEEEYELEIYHNSKLLVSSNSVELVLIEGELSLQIRAEYHTNIGTNEVYINTDRISFYPLKSLQFEQKLKVRNSTDCSFDWETAYTDVCEKLSEFGHAPTLQPSLVACSESLNWNMAYGQIQSDLSKTSKFHRQNHGLA